MVSSKLSKKQLFFYILGKKGVQDDAKMSQEKEAEEQEDSKNKERKTERKERRRR